MASQSEGQVGEVIALIALDGVLPVESLLGTDFLVAIDSQYRRMEVNRVAKTYRSSAMVLGRAMREVPVSRMTPVSSRSAVWPPNVMASS